MTILSYYFSDKSCSRSEREEICVDNDNEDYFSLDLQEALCDFESDSDYEQASNTFDDAPKLQVNKCCTTIVGQ